MAKLKLVVNKDVLAAVVADIEANGALESRLALFKEAHKRYNERVKDAPITFSVVGLRIVEFAIPMKTTKGKRGPRTKTTVSVVVKDETVAQPEIIVPESAMVNEPLVAQVETVEAVTPPVEEAISLEAA